MAENRSGMLDIKIFHKDPTVIYTFSSFHWLVIIGKYYQITIKRIDLLILTTLGGH